MRISRHHIKQKNMTKILAFAGSSRSGSLNDRLLSAACEIANGFDSEINHIQLSDFEMPLYNQDLEAEGFPDTVIELNRLFRQHDSLLIACPEYNSSITPLLKNVIDWTSRPNPESGPLEAYHDKTACLLSASPGALGGLRGLRHVREILSNINVLVVPNQFALTSAAGAFDDSGSLSDESNRNRLTSCIESFVNVARRQNSNG